MRSNYIVVPHDGDLEGSFSGDWMEVPGDGNQSRLGKPRLGIDDSLHEELDAFQTGAHGSNNTGYGIASSHCRAPTIGWYPEGCWFEAVEPAICSGTSDASW